MSQTVFAQSAEEDGETALMRAAACGRAEIVEALLNKGAKLEAKDEGGHTALLVAFSGALVADVPAEARRSFIDESEDLATCTDAIPGGHQRVIRLLIARGANVNIRATDRGETPLVIAATLGAVELVRLLLEHDVDVNQKSWDDDTVLQWLKNIDAALSEPHAEEDQALYEWLRATAPGRAEIVRLLRQAGAKR
ncbi:MAG: ankyrin repeat domain-containing protein [Acidobacteria bacterium]|nr:ankyrin repeat domain-containing protein [Acidobacteriota bacterium]